MIILYDNFVDDSTIDAFTEVPTATFDEGLKDSRLSRTGKTMANIDQYITFDLGESKSVKYVALLNTNFTDDVTLSVSGNSTADMTTPEYTGSFEKYDNVYIVKLDETLRYWRIDFDDPTNTEEQLSIGLVYIGGFLQCPGMDPTQSIPRIVTDTVSKSETGQVYGDKRLYYREFEVSFPLIEQSEKVLLDALFVDKRITDPMIVIPWEESMDVESPIYAIIKEGLKWTKTGDSSLLWNLSMSFEEVF